MRRLRLQVAYTSAARIYNLLVAVSVLAITARYLGPDGRGVLAAATAWASLFAVFGGLSLSQVVFYHAAGRPAVEWLPKALGALFAIDGAVILLCWLVAAAAYLASGGRSFAHLDAGVLALAMGAVPLLIWIDHGGAVFTALDELRRVNLGLVLGATTNLTLTFVLLSLWRWGVKGGLTAALVGQAIAGTVLLSAVIRRGVKPVLDARVTGEFLKGSAKLHLNAIGTFLFTQAAVLIINQVRSSAETGYYQLASQLINVIQIVPTAVSMVAYSIVTQEGPDRAWPQHRRLLLEALAAVMALGVAGYFVSPLAIRLLAGEAFLPAVPLFRILLLTLVGMTLSIGMAAQWIARGLFVLVAGLTVAVGGIHVVATYLLVPRYGLEMAAWVTVGVYGVSALVNGGMAVWVEGRSRAARAPVLDG